MRIGGLHTFGYTDCLTVMEKSTFATISNATNSDLRISLAQDDHTLHTRESTPSAGVVTTPSAGGEPFVAIPQSGIAHIGYRLNQSLNCTVLDGPLNRSVQNLVQLQNFLGEAQKNATPSSRYHAYQFLSNAASAYDGEETPTEPYYFPLYVANEWT